MLHRFLSTKARRSQLGAADPLAHGEENQSSSRIMKYAEDRDRVDSDTTSRLRSFMISLYTFSISLLIPVHISLPVSCLPGLVCEKPCPYNSPAK